MDNQNGSSRSWTDPITGEIYQSGNPHVSIQKSKTVDPSIKVTSFREPDPPVQEIYPQQAMPTQQAPRVTPAPPPVQQADPMQRGNIPIPVERPQRGVPVPSGITRFCEKCGSVIDSNTNSCPLCGSNAAAYQQVGAKPMQQQQLQQTVINVNNGGRAAKDKWVALFLCFFFGTFGVHRFYEGKMGTGLLYFFTFGLFGIGWLVDMVRIAAQPRQYYV